MLAEKTGVHKDQIRLIFKGKPMNDEKVGARKLRGGKQAAARACEFLFELPADAVSLMTSVLLPDSLSSQTLAEQQVTAGSTVHMIMQMRGGC